MTTASAAARRDPTIDAAKGIAIIAIVLGHVLRGLAAADIVEPTPGYDTADIWLYSWHLPVFALLSGLFVARAVQRDGTRAYLLHRLALFGYLYLLWTALQGVVKLAAPAGVNVPIGWQSLLQLWLPDGQLWFLPWIAIMTVLGALAAPWRSARRARITLLLAVMISLLTWGFDGMTVTGAGGVPGQVIGTAGWGLLGYYLAGVWLGADRYRTVAQQAARPVTVLLAVVSWALAAVMISGIHVTPPSTGGATRTALSMALGVAISLVCTAAVLMLARAVSDLRVVGPALAFCGRHSLEIFLAHIIATAGTRTILLAAGITALAVHIVAATLIGVVAPLLLWRLGAAVRIPWLFALPSVRRSSAKGIRPRPGVRQTPEQRQDVDRTV